MSFAPSDERRTLVARERATTSELLAHIAEVDARRLYAPAGFASMYAYCVEELHLSEDSAYRRIRAARTARQFPAIFGGLSEGHLNLTSVILLAPHLTRANAAGLLKAAAHKSRSEIEVLLARRFPSTDLLPMVKALPGPARGATDQLAPAPVEAGSPESDGSCEVRSAPVVASGPRSKAMASAPDRFSLQLTIDGATHEKLRHAQALLSHRIPSGDLASVLDLALDALVAQLEKRRFAKTDRPRPRRRATRNGRHVPAHVKRTVWQRDGGRCTFVGENGRRCNARKFLEFDHIEPVARGGQATVGGVRLRCRAHNQYEADRVFGAGFMAAKREISRAARTHREADAPSDPAGGPAGGHSGDVMSCLRSLGFRVTEARQATEFCMTVPGASLEERVRTALKFLCKTPARPTPCSSVVASGG